MRLMRLMRLVRLVRVCGDVAVPGRA